MSESKLTLSQIRVLKELKKKYNYDLALYEDELDGYEMSDRDMLDSLIIMELNEKVTGAVEELLDEYIDSHVIAPEEALALTGPFFAAIAVNSFKALAEDGDEEVAQDLSEELLHMYSELNPRVKVVMFSGDSIEIHSEPLKDEEE